MICIVARKASSRIKQNQPQTHALLLNRYITLDRLFNPSLSFLVCKVEIKTILASQGCCGDEVCTTARTAPALYIYISHHYHRPLGACLGDSRKFPTSYRS